jgi:dimethylargininase
MCNLAQGQLYLYVCVVLLQVAESTHLKALVSMAGPDVICVGAGKTAQEVLKVRGK